MADNQDMSPSEAQALYDGLMWNKDRIQRGRYVGLPPVERQALAQVIWRKLREGERQVDIAEELGISQPTVSNLKREAIEAFLLPTVENARKDYLNHCEDQVAYYTSKRAVDPDTDRWHNLLLKWEQELAKVTGAYAPIEVQATHRDITPEEHELQLLIEEQERENRAKERALRASHSIADADA